jgi:hypothetical protein
MTDANDTPLDDGPRSIGVTMLLADSAQVADRKLFILGGGLSLIGPRPQPIALAIRLLVPWDRANIRHEWLIEMLDEDGQPVMSGERPLQIRGNVVAGRPAGARPGTPLPVPLALNLGALKLPGDKHYAFQLSIDGESRPDWRVSFDTRADQQAPTAPPPT